MPDCGTVYLVGAGPGDVGLLTLRGAELLRRADVVVYDALVNPDLLRLAPKSAEIIYGGKRAKAHAIPQEDLNQLLVAKAKLGKCVVRLKGGDPYVFGRGGEEAEELADASVPFEVVPGISSIIAAGNYAGIPITHRDHCSSFTVFTGHEDPNKVTSNLDWSRLAQDSGTKVVLMGAERIRQVAAQLVAHGADKKMPVAMIRWGTTGRQRVIEGTLGNIADIADKAKFGAPAVTLIGGVVGLRKKLNWFERRPLFGKRVVVTRTREQASQLSVRLAELGADVLEIPTIKIAPPQDKVALVESIVGLGEYDWLVFTSPNGVTAFFDYYFKVKDDLRDLGQLRFAAVGPATAAKIKELHLHVDAMPEKYVAKAVAKAIGEIESVENLRLLLLRAEVSTPELPKQLEEMGAIVDDVAVYRTVPETEDITGAATRFEEEGADWITFASSSAVENFNARFDLSKCLKKFPKMKLLSIGPETSKAILELGCKSAIESRQHNIDGMVSALLKSVARR